MLSEINLKQSYHKPEDDIASEFYLPCLERSTEYDRAVGYFSSAVYVLAWKSLQQFIDANGRIRLICSPYLTGDDSDALYDGYSARADSDHTNALVSEFKKMLASPSAEKPARVLAALIAIGVVDIKIAWMTSTAGGKSKRLFHDKLGIFSDAGSNVVAFKGSMNETWSGLSIDGNLESVDVFVNWREEGEKERVENEKTYFDKLWSDDFPGVQVRPISEIARNEFVANADPEGWPDLLEEICLEIDASMKWAPANTKDPRVPRAHQSSALDAWESQGRRGILKHATGSGKTFTALCAISAALKKGEVPVILVPSDLLLQQWALELKEMFGQGSCRILTCGGGNSAWRTNRLLEGWTRPRDTSAPRIVLSTLQTASTEPFRRMCADGDHLFLVIDEVHRAGAIEASKILELDSGPRLGLSATPERAGDPEGTTRILDYFGGIVPPPFTLNDAIAAGALTQYSYHVYRIDLTADEQERWSALTKKISVQYARMKSTKGNTEDIQRKLKMDLIRRARIVKAASNKVEAAVKIVNENYTVGSRWIVYCDDQSQLGQIRDAIDGNIVEKVYEYHSAMTGSRENTLAVFERYGGIVVSIRCLDEGVDIPAVDTALILASSRNPREYVQRRGRVLRKYEGKHLSTIHDVLVTPILDPDEPPETSIVEGEIARAIEFGKSAINPSCIASLERLAIEFGLEFDRLITAGVEIDDIPGEVENA